MGKRFKLVDLLKLRICSICPSSVKAKNDKNLMCHWDEDPITPCLKVLKCGNWPDWSEALCSITLSES